MKFDFTMVLKNIEGNALKETFFRDNPNFINKEETPNEQEQIRTVRPLTLKDACINALLSTPQDERNLTGVKKFIRYSLATKISNDENVELTNEEIVEIKALVGKMYATVVVGRVYEILEGVTTDGK